MTKFNPIQPPFGWEESWTKYPHGYTIFEALLDWLKLVNALTEKVNDVDTLITNFMATFSVDLKQEVLELLTLWKNDGTLETLISEVISSEISAINEVFVKARDFNTLQEAVNFAADRLIITPPVLGSADQSNVIVLTLEKTQYNLITPLNVPGFLHIKGNGAILKAPNGGQICTSTQAYRVTFEDVVFAGEDVEAINFDIPNLDMAKYEFIRCKFSTHAITPNKYAVKIKSQSARVVFKECDVISAPNFLNVESDFCLIEGGWINGWSPLSPTPNTKPADSCSILNKTRHMVIKHTVFIPELDGSGTRSKVRWIDNYGQLSIDGAHFGGENAGFPLIYQYITGENNTPPFTDYADISVTNSQTACGGASRVDAGLVILMPNVLPGRYTFKNLTYLVDGAPLINAIHYDYSGTQASANALLRTKFFLSSSLYRLAQCSILAENISLPGGVPAVLKPYLNRVSHTSTGSIISPSVATPITFMDGLKITAGSGDQRSTLIFDMVITLLAKTPGGLPIIQIKKTQFVSSYTGNSIPNVDILTGDFVEYAPGGGALGDTLLSLAGGAFSNNAFTLTVEIGNSVVPQALQWGLVDIKTLGGAGAEGGLAIARNY